MATVDITRIASNIGALNSLNSLMNINAKLATHQTRLSTGKRINSASDDPAGLTIATKMLARSEGLKVTLDNIGDAKNMLSVAEGGLSKMNDILVQMRNKAEQAASDTLGTTERQTIQTQLSAYAEQIDNIVAETKWNSVKLLDGTVSKQFQTGVDAGENTTWSLTQNHGAGSTGLGISTSVDNNLATVSTYGAATAITASATAAANFSALQTGNYQIEVKGVAESITRGTITSGSVFSNANFVLSASDPAAAANEIANGTTNIQIKDYNYTAGAGASTIDYSVDGGTNWVEDAVITGDLSTANGTLLLQKGGGNSGLTLTITSNADTRTDIAGLQSSAVDYIKMGYAKAQLQTAEGAAITVNNSGASSYFYLNGTAGGVATDTGRALSVTSDTLANMTADFTAGTKSFFNYKAKNAYSVDVSTANLAAGYMQTVNNAMDTVNNSMSSLGSLMARLTFKEESISTAQVNVEASYNRIMNANMAEEQMNASKYTILQQTAIAMLAQANQAPQNLLSLFR